MKQNNGCHCRPDLRLAIYLRDEFTCVYCGIDLYSAESVSITLDHLKPQKNGVNNKPSNLVTACRRCNCSRQDKAWKSFATGGAINRILKHRRRSIKRYRKLANELIQKGWVRLKSNQIQPITI